MHTTMVPMLRHQLSRKEPEISPDMTKIYILLGLVISAIVAICIICCVKSRRTHIQRAVIVGRVEPGTKIYTVGGQEITT